MELTRQVPQSTAAWTLFLLASLHLTAELGHFLIGVVSKYVARDVHYGTLACFPSEDVPGIVVRGVEGIAGHERSHAFNQSECGQAKNQSECEIVTANDGSTHACHWTWTGQGSEYQFLAGPSFMAIFTLASIVWGVLADKFDRVYVLFTATIIFSMALVTTSVATQYWHLVALRMLLAGGVAGIAPIAPGIIFDMFTQNERALAMGFFHWGIYLGSGLTFVVGKYVTEMNLWNAGWRSTFILSGLPGAVLAILTLFTVEDPPKSHKGLPTGHHHLPTSPEEVEEQEQMECCDGDDTEVLIYSREPHTRDVPGGNGSHVCCLSHPVVYLLGLGACLRHAAGFTWSYNSALYFQTYYPTYSSANMWLSWITIFGGSCGVILGGYLSDRLVAKMGISSRALVIAVSQLAAAPFALGLLHLPPPLAFMSLFVGYLFAEMWYGVVFAILVELLPTSVRSLGLAISLFVVNNVGGNLPIVVTPLTTIFGFRGALTILYPGALLASSLLFFMTYLVLRKNRK